MTAVSASYQEHNSPQYVAMTLGRPTSLLFLIAILLAGCISTEKRFERAVGYEEAGDYQRAASYYISVLKKESSWDEAREGLERVGAIAVDRLLDDANAEEDRGEYDDAIDVLNDLDDLRADALGVGVNLALPQDYDDYRDRLSESAIVSMIRRGEVAEEEGDWEEAIDTYAQVQEKYRLSVDQNEEMVLARGRVHMKWAEQDLEKGYYRSAFDRATDAVGVLGEDHPRAGGAFDLQDQALEEGTRLVAFLPIWLTEDVAEFAPGPLVDELNDMMDYDFWAQPPAFIAAADPVELRREVRRLRYDRKLVTRSEAATIGDVLEADYVVINQAVVFRAEETRLREKTKKAKTRGRNGLDTTYVEQSFTMRIEAEIEYEVIDTETRREIESGSVSSDVSAKMQRGIYEGDYRDLDLSRRERRLFDEEEVDLQIRELEDELLDELAPRLADEVFEELLKHIK